MRIGNTNIYCDQLSDKTGDCKTLNTNLGSEVSRVWEPVLKKRRMNYFQTGQGKEWFHTHVHKFIKKIQYKPLRDIYGDESVHSGVIESYFEKISGVSSRHAVVTNGWIP